MSELSDNDIETEVVSRNLCGIVDIGSNGIRFSISSKAYHHARIMPCVFKDRVGVSLNDIQFSKNLAEREPIPDDIITEICSAMRRFKLICEDFGLPDNSIRVIATQATRDAINSKQFVDSIYQSTGWEVEILSKIEEGKLGVYGVVSSFNTISGLYLDLGCGHMQLSWIKCENGEIIQSSQPISLPYGSSRLTGRLGNENTKDLFFEIKNSLKSIIADLNIPQDLIEEARSRGGFDLWTRGGGLRGLAHLLLSQYQEYPIQTIINGLAYSYDEFSNMCDYLFLKNKIPGTKTGKIFKLSEKRAVQLPAVGLLMSALFDALPKIKTIHFSEGGVREGTMYSLLPNELRAQDPLVVASRPYAPLLAEKYLRLLQTSFPGKDVPSIINKRIAPALCNLAFVHASYPKELQPTAALHVATRGIISGCHGLSHRTRALIGIALCNRWGGNIPETEEKYLQALENVVLREGSKLEAKRIVWWTKYVGTIMYVICGVHPGGNIRDGVFDFRVVDEKQDAIHLEELKIDDCTGQVVNNESETKFREFDVVVRISKDDLKTSASVRSRIITMQKKIRKLSTRSVERVRIGVKFYE
ncbi:similar to Saccharomyces cerevisiae YGL252C RTG2 Sensor of mitochondrial dysfunction [Maudiozyma barnettii]|uniref:Similar to Saccharomyces cerevisiae YGL252C RTG2 Sensor of mitochondrial dysfunction n=1 Tax=Maudiozyma barnettii TaxID=61262 RepID=A0A8H2ZF48_9SACH|nr:Rtg2p [Kazachstania barnettii]CAB4251950.1 similar to Saccharomyces cerevisiae YGL252C RTG2 Sensor of mitochondrial dysfunction [Kazachstania barnettii]CAD1778319.1 similar to Saccharomyces cerevisiae YGL252C RTG2 Sensor of mitochondrial dysfunction [Kazachstania barnettii]